MAGGVQGWLTSALATHTRIIDQPRLHSRDKFNTIGIYPVLEAHPGI